MDVDQLDMMFLLRDFEPQQSGAEEPAELPMMQFHGGGGIISSLFDSSPSEEPTASSRVLINPSSLACRSASISPPLPGANVYRRGTWRGRTHDFPPPPSSSSAAAAPSGGGTMNSRTNYSASSSMLSVSHDHEENHQSSMTTMREMIFRIAAMQPIHIDPESVKPPKRKNVKISKDPQSVAARHRRERISERIRILQRLVPGGTKMDTASMLDEAIHYVKFLKTQVQSLEQQQPAADGLPPPPPPPMAATCSCLSITGSAYGYATHLPHHLKPAASHHELMHQNPDATHDEPADHYDS